MFIDAHSHLDHYGDDIQTVITEMEQHRILTVSVAMDVPTYQKNLQLAAMSNLVLPTFGIHPWQALEYVNRLDELHEHIKSSPMLGEIGLDYHWVEDASQFPAQRRVLEFFLAAAHEQNKIVNLHTKGAEKEILDLLDDYHIERAIIHWYSGPLDLLDQFLARRTYFTVGIELLYSEHIRNIAQRIPRELLLTEMDNPGGAEWLNSKMAQQHKKDVDQALENRQDSLEFSFASTADNFCVVAPGMPAMLIEVIDALATLYQSTPRQVKQIVLENFLRLIRGDPGLAHIYSLIELES